MNAKLALSVLLIASFGVHAETSTVYKCGEYTLIDAKDFIDNGVHENYIAITKGKTIIAGNSEVLNDTTHKPMHTTQFNFDGTINDVAILVNEDKTDKDVWAYMMNINGYNMTSRVRIVDIGKKERPYVDCQQVSK